METTNLIYLSFLSECTQNTLKYQGEDNFRRGQPILIWSFLFRLSQTRAHIFYKVTTVSLWSSVPHPSSPKQSKIPRTVEEHNFLRRKKRGRWWPINHVHKLLFLSLIYPPPKKNWDSLEESSFTCFWVIYAETSGCLLPLISSILLKTVSCGSAILHTLSPLTRPLNHNTY